MKINELTPIYIDIVPDNLEEGKLYISFKYNIVTHLCACGCKNEVVTPLNNIGWKLTNMFDKISLTPSIGNFNFPCKSHYYIRDNKIIWL